MAELSNDKKPNLVEFLDEVGSSRLSFQMLDRAMTNITSTRGGSKVTFVTTEISPGHVVTKTGKVGMVVWMERSDYERAVQTIS